MNQSSFSFLDAITPRTSSLWKAPFASSRREASGMPRKTCASGRSMSTSCPRSTIFGPGCQWSSCGAAAGGEADGGATANAWAQASEATRTANVLTDMGTSVERGMLPEMARAVDWFPHRVPQYHLVGYLMADFSRSLQMTPGAGRVYDA